MCKLYHFCAAHMVESIKKNGLTLGRFPVLGDGHITLIGGLQWLTAESTATKQSWATSTLIPYSRTAYRLTIEIPAGHERKLFKALDFARQLPPGNERLITDWEGGDQWYIFKGKIPPRWITEVAQVENTEARLC